jgi:hypothetical protein
MDKLKLNQLREIELDLEKEQRYIKIQLAFVRVYIKKKLLKTK